MKLFKKITAMVLAGMLALNGTTAFAEGAISNVDVNMNEEYDEVYAHACKMLPRHLDMFDYAIDNVEMSNIYPMVTSIEGEEMYLCFALENGQMIGEMVISRLSTGELTTAFSLCSFPALNEAIAKGEPIGFYGDDGALYLTNGYSMTEIDRDVTSESSLEAVARRRDQIPLKTMESEPIATVFGTSSVSDPLYKCKYDVKIIKNPDYYKGHDGICWAACVASKVRYEVVSYANKTLTAENVYDATAAANNGDVGSGKVRYQRGLAVYGITANDNSGSQVFSFPELHKKESNGNLVIFRIKRDGASHAILLSGYIIYSESEGGVYYFMDPNKTRMYTAEIDGKQYKTGENVHYKPSSDRDYTWFDSMYTK
ncbi:MAG: hypothetical protein NC084_13365 [Bacteroides sp.]|nr:hypothetical protein [Eubacterium sp.]MCM1419690.1 hypothetical protein [Roseburia sp.]MCM1463686.1 hypothetical protein [Bacteroides sp.]